jgi:hypothetical protein
MSYLEMALEVIEEESRRVADTERRGSLTAVGVPDTQRSPEEPASCGSACCAGCYEVAPGVRIHPPKCGLGWAQ